MTDGNKKRLSLGIDISTQSLTSVVLDIDSREKVYEHSLDYSNDLRLDYFGLQRKDYIVPPSNEGEANQPVKLFFASLDAMMTDMKNVGVALNNIIIINSSGQQHGHIYLNQNARSIFAHLRHKGSGQSSLLNLLDGCLAWEMAPIWMTSNTVNQAKFIRSRVGGKQRMIQLSGSNAPPRFTGAVIRRVAEQYPEIYQQTENIQLISSLIPAILSANSKVPLDFGNSCGMSLMDYSQKQWSEPLVRATSEGLPGGEKAFLSKLPAIVAPDTIVGRIARYFVEKYGFDPGCRIVAGSGDNPQSKVLVTGDLLSLGSSFVNMVATDGKTLDMNGFANAMYDGIGKPFIFGCRTNGGLVWDRLRALYGMGKEEFGPGEEALRQTPAGKSLVFWQPRDESFPPSGSYAMIRLNNIAPELGSDYAGLIESSLTAVYYHARSFAGETSHPLYVTGGAIGSNEIMRRVAAIWRRPVISIEEGGAALGAVVAGIQALSKIEDKPLDIEQFCTALLKRGSMIQPRSEDVTVFHEPGGYLDRFAAEEARLIAEHPGPASN